jgi:hypothetical protein
MYGPGDCLSDRQSECAFALSWQLGTDDDVSLPWIAYFTGKGPKPATASHQNPVEIREYHRKLQEARMCPHLTRENCGCVWGRCTIGQGKGMNGESNAQDCMKCISEGRNQPKLTSDASTEHIGS